MIEKEFERKLVVEEDDYYALLNYFDKNNLREDILQINYYYDTHDFDVYNSDETIRVRQIKNKLKLQYKYNKNHSGDIRISDESSKEISELPQVIKTDKFETQNIGMMVTERINFIIKECTISLDKNYYLGVIDYEIEVETVKEIDISEIIQDIRFTSDGKSKYIRFIEKLIKQNAKCELQNRM